jgi:cellulase
MKMTIFLFLCPLVVLLLAEAQQIGQTPEHHPRLTTHHCTKEAGCIPRKTSIVIDAQWREIYDIRTGDLCIADNGKLNNSICPTVEACAAHCALDGIDYPSTGVEVADDGSVTLQMYEKYQGELVEVGPQIYLLSEKEREYEMLHLLNQEISFAVDLSQLPCGMDGAIYLAGMDPSGGRSGLNPAGAAYGTGYCDSQCYQSYNFINGVANLDHKGACCNEMDLLEANSRSMQYTAHPCEGIDGLYECHGKDCDGGSKGICDNVGCGFNPYGLGDRGFFGLEGRVNTSKPFRVVTQFHTDDQTVSGTLVEIRRLYIQDGRTINTSLVSLGHHAYDSLTADFCRASHAKSFHRHGGLAAMGEALKRGMVLIMGIWGGEYMTWLDSGDAGPCSKREDRMSFIKKNSPDTTVKFDDIRWGDIGSTTCRRREF